MALTHLLYLHGFRSSPASVKSRKTQAAALARFAGLVWHGPQLPVSPRAAMGGLLRDVAGWPVDSMAVVGSSLGGFYATALAERLGCRAVLLNPAVHPARDLAAHVGEHTLWHHPEERFLFEPAFVQELLALEVPRITRPERYMAVIAKGDEVLDWREMVAAYGHDRLRLIEGSDHALSDFEAYLPEILDFLALSRGAAAWDNRAHVRSI